jgi:cytochrome c5
MWVGCHALAAGQQSQQFSSSKEWRMSTTLSMWLGLVFVMLAVAASVLQAWLWGFPMLPDPGGPDPNGKSTAPRFWTQAHRVMGALYVLIYVFMMWHMVPRLWEYQVELPARTVMHLCVAICIGVLIVTKVSIIRWFQHFGKALPALGLGLLTCTIILAVLSLPFAVRAHGLLADVYTEKNLARVQKVLSGLELSGGVTPAGLTTKESLIEGREVLAQKCIVCHDMRTIMVKPRTGKSWQKVVRRMAEKPTLGPKFEERDEDTVTAFLVAISPDLQQSVRLRRKQAREQKEAAANAVAAMKPSVASPSVAQQQPSEAEVKDLYESRCTECHELTDVEEYGGDSKEGWGKVVQQMIEEEEAELSAEEARLIIDYLAKHYPQS